MSLFRFGIVDKWKMTPGELATFEESQRRFANQRALESREKPAAWPYPPLPARTLPDKFLGKKKRKATPKKQGGKAPGKAPTKKKKMHDLTPEQQTFLLEWLKKKRGPPISRRKLHQMLRPEHPRKFLQLP